MREKIQGICTDFFENLGVDYSELCVQQEGENIFNISLHSTDSHLLIGPHGKNIDTLTHILKLIIARVLLERVIIHLEVNDYILQKKQKLLHFIQTKIDLVKKSGKEIQLPALGAYERKIVHTYVSENGNGVSSESRGEGIERRMHIYKKEEKTTVS